MTDGFGGTGPIEVAEDPGDVEWGIECHSVRDNTNQIVWSGQGIWEQMLVDLLNHPRSVLKKENVGSMA